MSDKVYIAGLGTICAIGNTADECLASLKKGQDGIGEPSYLRTTHAGEIPVAEVKLSNAQLAEMTGLPAGTSRTALLSMVAAKAALQDSGLALSQLRTGFISANTVGGMDKSEDFFADFMADEQNGDLAMVRHHECGSVTELVADQLGIKNYVTTISTACSSSANAIAHAARLIKAGILDAAIAGGTDALTRFTLNGFNTLMILDRQHCQPFDENRRGLNLGEGAGYVLLVSAKLAATLSKQPYVQLSGYANANDAYHQTASSPEGTGSYLSMSKALERAGLQAQDISYINLHGTGTNNNDQSEATAIQRLFQPHFPPVSSTKSFTGHTLGASGGIEAVFSVLAIANGLVFPNLRLQDAMLGFDFSPQRKLLTGQPLTHVLSNSFGFGGNCTSLLFSKVS